MGKHRAVVLQTELSLQSPRNPQWEEMGPQIRKRIVELVGELLLSWYKSCGKNMHDEERRENEQNH